MANITWVNHEWVMDFESLLDFLLWGGTEEERKEFFQNQKNFTTKIEFLWHTDGTLDTWHFIED